MSLENKDTSKREESILLESHKNHFRKIPLPDTNAPRGMSQACKPVSDQGPLIFWMFHYFSKSTSCRDVEVGISHFRQV